MFPAYGLDSFLEYRIEVAGLISYQKTDLLDSTSDISMAHSPDENITVISGIFDQAGLLGLLRRLYYLGTPLLSVNQIEHEGGRKNSPEDKSSGSPEC